ncbi:Hydrogenase isoenzymes formation protein HypE [Fuerstiella marisgermanici]|uniref:Hydrogenase isoenzymes formation protein HypE n=2 Tax=Fuerstiella marisgermanici TaxID=1891926 RepID=A0A1P8WBM3_9PLAN|nr:Hydrogenase isoenzymes formation protein HypE [Fuerstiella marisgermanici]
MLRACYLSHTSGITMSDSEGQPTQSVRCALPSSPSAECVSLAHGEGARATRQLIARHILPNFHSRQLESLPDAAQLSIQTDRIAITTDSFVVSPLFFPGGDIGSMAVYGTVNDLAVSGAAPKWLSVALIIEEGFTFQQLDQILANMSAAAKRCDVEIVTGDTKVVPRGAMDGLFINTTGIGELRSDAPSGPSSLHPGDAIIVSGPIGSHGMAVLTAREKLALSPPPQSDSGPLHEAVAALLNSVGSGVRAIRDATRGGVSAVLHEWADAAQLTMQLSESLISVTAEVRGACELLGMDPLYIANEGTMVVAVDPTNEAEALAALKSCPQTQGAVRIGTVQPKTISPVTITRLLGVEQPVDEPTGAMLPRIC